MFLLDRDYKANNIKGAEFNVTLNILNNNKVSRIDGVQAEYIPNRQLYMNI